MCVFGAFVLSGSQQSHFGGRLDDSRTWPKKKRLFAIYLASCNFFLSVRCLARKVLGRVRDFEKKWRNYFGGPPPTSIAATPPVRLPFGSALFFDGSEGIGIRIQNAAAGWVITGGEKVEEYSGPARRWRPKG